MSNTKSRWLIGAAAVLTAAVMIVAVLVFIYRPTTVPDTTPDANVVVTQLPGAGTLIRPGSTVSMILRVP